MPMRRPVTGAGAAFRATVVVAAEWRFVPQPAASSSTTARRTRRGGHKARPVREQMLSSTYLTAEGMPLILPSLSSLYCAATAARMEAGTFGLHLP